MARSDRGRGLIDFEKWSETIMKAVWPWDSGSTVRKSSASCGQGYAGMGRGISLPVWRESGTLDMAQTVQDEMNLLISFSMLGHQYFEWS